MGEHSHSLPFTRIGGEGLRLKGDGHVWRPKRPPGETTSGNHESNSGLGGWVPKLKLSLNIATCD